MTASIDVRGELQFICGSNSGTFTLERQLASSQEDRFSRQLRDAALPLMATLGNSIRRCDAKQPLQGETYVMFTELMQVRKKKGNSMPNIWTTQHIQ